MKLVKGKEERFPFADKPSRIQGRVEKRKATFLLKVHAGCTSVIMSHQNIVSFLPIVFISNSNNRYTAPGSYLREVNHFTVTESKLLSIKRNEDIKKSV